jgi:thymidylate synthase
MSYPRDQLVREVFDYKFSITNPKVEYIVTHDEERNKIIKEYSKKEFDLYNSCSNSAEDFGKASKFWLKLANPDGTINSAYGYLIWKNKSHGSTFEDKNDQPMRTPWEWAKTCLIDDKDTRQAILRFSLPEHQWIGNKDQTCTMSGLFSIRNDKLNLSIVMRSNDLVLGLVYDLPWFISLMHRMQEELKEQYPELSIGTYTHFVHNLHVYDRDEDKILKMLGRK